MRQNRLSIAGMCLLILSACGTEEFDFRTLEVHFESGQFCGVNVIATTGNEALAEQIILTHDVGRLGEEAVVTSARNANEVRATIETNCEESTVVQVTGIFNHDGHTFERPAVTCVDYGGTACETEDRDFNDFLAILAPAAD